MKDKIIYLTHKNKNAKVLRATTSLIARNYPTVCILNPRIVFSHFNCVEFMENSLTLLDMCDEMWIVDSEKNAENYETEYCKKHKIPIRIVRR